MNILQVIASPGFGGREIQPVKLAEEMRRSGHNTFLLVKPNAQPIPLIKKAGLPYFELKMEGYLNITSLLPLAKILKKKKIDIIHTHISKSLVFLLIARKISKRNIKLIFTQRMGVRVKKNDPFHKYVYKHTDRITAISEYVKNRLLRAAPYLKGRIDVVYNGIPIRKEKTVKDKKKFLNEFNIKKKDITIGLIGQINIGKGHFWTVRSLKLLKEKYKFRNFKIFFIGTGKLKKSLIQYAWKKKVFDEIIYTGFKKDVDYFFRNIDIVVAPSKSEAFGNIIIEGMSFGKPVICSDRGAFPEIIQNNKNGLMVEYKNAETLAKAIFTLAKKTGLRKKLGKNGKKTVYNRFDFKDTVRRYIELYSQ